MTPWMPPTGSLKLRECSVRNQVRLRPTVLNRESGFRNAQSLSCPMPEPLAVVASSAATFVIQYLLKFLGPKSRIVMWFPHNFLYQVPNQSGGADIHILTNSLSIQNIGRRTATNVEIAHATKPDHFKLSPPRDYVERTTPAGEHVIVLSTLAHGEWITVELLSYMTIPKLLYVRSDDGMAQTATVIQLRLWPAWARIGTNLLWAVGGGYLLYWLVKGAIALIHVLGK